jgi:hypothetical protein
MRRLAAIAWEEFFGEEHTSITSSAISDQELRLWKFDTANWLDLQITDLTDLRRWLLGLDSNQQPSG